jgi:hypothetical protein
MEEFRSRRLCEVKPVRKEGRPTTAVPYENTNVVVIMF